MPRTAANVRSEAQLRENRVQALDGFYARRPLINNEERCKIYTSLGLGILASLPPDNRVFKMMRQRNLGVSLLTSGLFDNMQSWSYVLKNTPVVNLASRIDDELPDSSGRSLHWVPVTGVMTWPESKPTHLALTLEAPELNDEFDALKSALKKLCGRAPKHDLTPHITIADFPAHEAVPNSVLECVEAIVPPSVHLGRVALGTFAYEI
jgi:hypothetical protein